MRERRVSWSMLALVASLTGAALIGAMTWIPPLIGRDSGVLAVTPGLLTVADGAGGVVTLGEGRAVALGPSGIQVTHGTDILYRTVRGGSPVSALRGSYDADDRRERVDQVLSDLTVTRLTITPGVARYDGVLRDRDDRLPMTLTVTFDGAGCGSTSRRPAPTPSCCTAPRSSVPGGTTRCCRTGSSRARPGGSPRGSTGRPRP